MEKKSRFAFTKWHHLVYSNVYKVVIDFKNLKTKTMKRNISLIATLLFISSIAFGQGYTFKVLANKGQNKVKSGAEMKPLKTGTSLNKTDELIVSENAYLGLVHSSGKTLEVKSAGTHKIADLASKVSTGESSVATKYADFVLSKMSAEGKKNRLSATGAVHRGDDSNQLNVFMPNSSNIFNEKAVIRWDSLEGSNTYIVTLKNVFEDELMTFETNDTNFELDLTSDKISKERVVLLSVKTKGDLESETYAVKRLSTDVATDVKSTLTQLMAGVDEPSALNKFILGGFYEEKGLIVDALTSYESAIKMAPDVESFKEAYDDFLFRNNLLK